MLALREIARPLESGDPWLKHFDKRHPPLFDGTVGHEAAENWIEGMGDVFEAVLSPLEHQICLCQTKLISDALKW